MTFDDDRNAPVRLDYFRLVRRLNEHLAPLGTEACVEEEFQEAWAGYFQTLAITESEVDHLGAWYAKHYSIGPSIPMLTYYVQHLREHGEFPEYRLITSTERNAGAILQACAGLGLDRYELADALFQAAALVHISSYRESIPDADPEFIRYEVEGRARMANFFSADILDEVQQGVGLSAHLRKILFPRH